MADTTATLGIAFETTGADKVKRDLQDVSREAKQASNVISEGSEEIRKKMGINAQWTASEQRVVNELLRTNTSLRLSGEALAVFNAQMAAGVAPTSAQGAAIAALAAENYALAQSSRAAAVANEAHAFSLRDLSRSARGANVALREMGVSIGEVRAISALARAGIIGIGAAAAVGFVGLFAALEELSNRAKIAEKSLSALLGNNTAGSATFANLTKTAQELGTTTSGLSTAFEAAYKAISGDSAQKALNTLDQLKERGFRFINLDVGLKFAESTDRNFSTVNEKLRETAKFFEALGDTALQAQLKAAEISNIIPKDQEGKIAATTKAMEAMLNVYRSSGVGIGEATNRLTAFFNILGKGKLTAEDFAKELPVVQQQIANMFGFSGENAIAKFEALLRRAPATTEIVVSQILKNAEKLKGLEIPPTIADSFDRLKNSMTEALNAVAQSAGFSGVAGAIDAVSKAVSDFVKSNAAKQLGDQLRELKDGLVELINFAKSPTFFSFEIKDGGAADKLQKWIHDTSKLREIASVPILFTLAIREGSIADKLIKLLSGETNINETMPPKESSPAQMVGQGVIDAAGALQKMGAAAEKLADPVQELVEPLQQAADAAQPLPAPLSLAATALDQTATAAPPAAEGLGKVEAILGGLGSAALAAAAQIAAAAAQIQASGGSGGGGISAPNADGGSAFDIGENLHGGFHRVMGSGRRPITGFVHGGETVAVIPQGGAAHTGTVAIPPSMYRGGAASAPYSFGAAAGVISGLPVAPGQHEAIAARRAAQATADNNTAVPTAADGMKSIQDKMLEMGLFYFQNGVLWARGPGIIGLRAIGGVGRGGGGGGSSRGGGLGGGQGGGHLGDYDGYSRGYGAGGGRIGSGPGGERSRVDGGSGGGSDHSYNPGMGGGGGGSGYYNYQPPKPSVSSVPGGQYNGGFNYQGSPYADMGGGGYEGGYDYGGSPYADTGGGSYYDQYFGMGYEGGGYDYTGSPYADMGDSGSSDPSSWDWFDGGGGYYDAGDYAEGGRFMVRGRGGRDANRMSMGLTSGEMVTVTPPAQNAISIGGGSEGAGGGEYHFHFHGDSGRQLVNDSQSRLAMRRFVQRSLNG